MTRKIIIWVMASLTISVGIIGILFAMSGMLKDTRNSFLRLFPSHPLEEGNVYALQYNSYYIAGSTSNSIFLGNYTSPFHLLVLNKDLTDTAHVTVHVNGVMEQKFWSTHIRIDSPNFYFYDGAVPRIFTGSMLDWTANRIGFDDEYFLDIEPIKAGSFFIKSLSRNGENMLGKISESKPHYKFNSDLLQKQNDGVFCTDGSLNYDRKTEQLIYLYRYRNEFIVTDTNLNLRYRGNTIDTTTKAAIKVARLDSKNASTLAAPPIIVNKQSAVYNGWLFVNSNLLAQNDHPDAFKQASVIDLYDVAQSKYLFSFYIFHQPGNEKLRDYIITDGRFIALFDTKIQTYTLNDFYFKNL